MTYTQPEAAAAAVSLKKQGLKVQPLQRNYSLDKIYPSFKVQPHIGTEFKEGIQIRDLLKAPNSDELLLDLAVLISERNVVFLRNQDVTFEEQKEFVDRLGKLTGKPATSGLHIHPTTDETSEFGFQSLEIDSEKGKKFGDVYRNAYGGGSEFQSTGWHSDITFEPVPSDYAALRLRDTLWASSYEIYERLSPAFQKFLEGKTASHRGDGFKLLEQAGITKLYVNPRGAPENVGNSLSAVHPVIRTNPVTGWKSVFVNHTHGFTKRINELSKDESDLVLNHIFNLTAQNHDLQVRFKWGKHDVAVWDNRSTFHSATTDYDAEIYRRNGERATSLGERPYFDANSSSRREALGIAPPTARRAHLASLAEKSA
ncbi:taurine catabolism dioxygenase [Rhizoclosmatium globosum]|uniref:Taurine catabolism dioxygenase n=1 Tax=Rhizoclosmatium globosum TaxID=329046 RepID=A0A1Y2BZX3_9FUNG|nr:taurine catabolism dioxygenase [Rhizoclosmatium globosum]|eukprot:ORY40177.1 taurine catabolism dioxygenase [Rhizoclosmatium globosum]